VKSEGPAEQDEKSRNVLSLFVL